MQTIWGRFFQPRLRFASLEKLNGWLEAEPPRPLTIITSEDSALRYPPITDCARYDQMRTFDAAE